jgi:ABC-type Fe3+-hydroxamate transport system substrate-binding protein
VLAGRTRFCTEPADLVHDVPVVGGTKNPDVARIVSLKPGLVIANKEENRREDVDALREAGLDVLLTDPNSVDDALEMIALLGARLGVDGQAAELLQAIRAELAVPLPTARPRVFVAVWRSPLLGLGRDTYGHDLIERTGAINVLGDVSRYPETNLDHLARLKPDTILLPDEPYAFRERHIAEFAGIAPARLIDGKLLWWYGPRLPLALRTLRSLFAETLERT